MAVFALMLLAMLLAMVMSVGRQIEGKIRLQNAADATAYSAGLVLARGMNGLAFTNNLLCETFAVTAALREARDRHAEQFAPEVLAAWKAAGGTLKTSGFPKFDALGAAIEQKIPREQELVDGYSEWAALTSALVLPIIEEILRQKMIPPYQRALVEATPHLAQSAAWEVARRHGALSGNHQAMHGELWRTMVTPVGSAAESLDRTLPVLDPLRDRPPGQDDPMKTAKDQREHHARAYLERWNNRMLIFFDHEAKMTQFGNLWRGFTCWQLNHLLTVEYPQSNLPHVLREPASSTFRNQWLDEDYMFMGVAYSKHTTGILPRLYRPPTPFDAQAFAQVHLFAPRPRLVWELIVGGGDMPIGGVPGNEIALPSKDLDADPPDPPRWVVIREPIPTGWDLFNQNWQVQLVPATAASLWDILQAAPPTNDSFRAREYRLPNLGRVTPRQLTQISTH